MNNRLIQILVTVLAISFSMWGMSALISATDAARNVTLGLTVFCILLIVLWRKIPVDAKLMFIVIMGYAFGGKGFAYVSPFEPVYIGEICLAVCVVGILLRAREWGIMDTAIHKLVWVLLLYSGFHLVFDWSIYGIVAIRDSSTSYYSIYFISAFLIFKKEKNREVFSKAIKVALFLAMISIPFAYMGLSYALAVRGIVGFSPHPDAFIPFVVGGSIFFVTKGLDEKKMFYIFISIVLAFMALTGKTAGFVAFVTTMGFILVFGKVKNLIGPFVVMGAISVVAIALMAVFWPDLLIENVASGDHAEAFGVKEGSFVGFEGTSDWRISWWRRVWLDTMSSAPILGQGFGADLTTPFLEEYYGTDPKSAAAQGYARYPHSIIFTVVGRLGLLGLLIFLMLFLALVIFSVKFCGFVFTNKNRKDTDVLVFSIFFAGLVNSLIQANYETPYGAIPHWICLGYLVSRYTELRRKELQYNQ